VFLDVGFTAASSHTLDCIICRFLTFDLAALTGRFQPITGARFDEMVTIKPSSAPWQRMTGLEQADRNWLQPVRA
jgi:hypothetical protein